MTIFTFYGTSKCLHDFLELKIEGNADLSFGKENWENNLFTCTYNSYWVHIFVNNFMSLNVLFFIPNGQGIASSSTEWRRKIKRLEKYTKQERNLFDRSLIKENVFSKMLWDFQNSRFRGEELGFSRKEIGTNIILYYRFYLILAYNFM